MKNHLIGISGWINSGKGAVGDILEEQGFAVTHLADPLREFISIVNPLVHSRPARRWNEVIEEVGYRAAKDQFPEVRRLMQSIGTDAGRSYLDPDLWIDPTRRNVSELWGATDKGVVIPDVRLKNEASFIQEGWAGLVIRVERPGLEELTGHESEHDLDDWPFDHVFLNDGTLDDLRVKVLSWLESISS